MSTRGELSIKPRYRLELADCLIARFQDKVKKSGIQLG
jgi:hypothetical protein